MRSPFKFLDAYTREDRDQFFGREEETAQLYETVNQNRLVLVYGPSGTGKTSLIQCGLGNRFEATDWLPIFIRRGNHLPTALQQSLEQQADDKLEGAFWEAEDENPLIELIEDLFAEYLRPVYLIFDQFEEIFVLGNAEEQAIFFEAMANIYAAKMPCRLLFVMREEYLAHLYEFEQKIPSLFKRRLRVETMSAQQASEVVLRSCERFNIKLESPKKNPLQIVSKITEGRSGVALPYLQVYLDRLYREDLVRTYPQGVPASPNDWPALEFTSAEIEEFGEIGDVLKNFLQEQSQQIQDDLPDLPERAVRKVLNSFASLQGTKIPQLRAEMKLAPLTDPQIDQILQRLQQARILREAEGRYELAHDTLAGEIAGQRDGQERALLEITELIRNRARAFVRTKTYLEIRELELIANYEGALREEQKLKDAEWDFIQRSEAEAKRKRRRTRLITSGVIGVLSIFLALAIWQGFEARANAKDAADKAREASIAKDNAEAATKETQRSLLNVYLKDMELLQADSLGAEQAVESGRRIELPPSMMQRRYDRLQEIKDAQSVLQVKIDSIGGLVGE